MRAVQIQQYGGPEVMQLQNVPEPEPGPGEVLIRVEVSSVNFHDGTDVFANLDVPRFSPLGLMSTVKAVMGVSLILDPELSGPWIEDLFRLHESGAIKPHIDTRFQLEEAAQAHRYIQDRKNRGKVLIMA